METIIKQLGKYSIDINNDHDEIIDSSISDTEKIMKLSYLVGKCMGKIRCAQLDLITLKEIKDGKRS